MSVRAFARGRRSKGVFHHADYRPLLDEKVGSLRRQLTLPGEQVRAEVYDAALFYLFVALSVVINFGPIIAIGLIIKRAAF
jgi:hypothetical protein